MDYAQRFAQDHICTVTLDEYRAAIRRALRTTPRRQDALYPFVFALYFSGMAREAAWQYVEKIAREVEG